MCAASALIPEPYVGKIEISRFLDGVGEAEKFRREILSQGASGGRTAELLARACLSFRNQLTTGTGQHDSLKAFKISEKKIVSALEGGRRWKQAVKAFDAFGGKWYGKWDQMQVDHHWYPVEQAKSPEKIGGFYDVYLLAAQFAWVGDGFGWNVVASENAEGKEGFVLGSVHHIEQQDPTQVRLHRPHVGVICRENQIIWITRGEIFFEERFGASKGQPERYVITGFRYRIDQGRLKNQQNAFQAVYTRDAARRPEWRQFWVRVEVE